jgi:hypothetical protein
MAEQKYSCQSCPRDDLSLTANGRVRSHAANGKRASAENPHCPGGSDWPLESTSFHRHNFEYMDDGNGHSGSFCVLDDCGLAEPENPGDVSDPRPTETEVREANAVIDSPGEVPADLWSVAEKVLQRAAKYGTRPDFPQPNPHRAPLPRGRLEEIAEQQATYPEGWGQPPVETGEGSSVTSQPSSTETIGAPTTVPSSSPTTTANVPSVTAQSSKETSSGASETATSSTPTASGTGSPASEATAFLNGPVGGPAASNAVPRDRWGRYLLPHPDTGRTQPWTRATTMASSVADTFALSMWSQRMVAKGLTMRDDLYALASTFDVAADKDDMNTVCDQAKAAAGDKVAANLGTAMHSFTARIDQGEKPNIPPKLRADVEAYSAVLRVIGLEIVPHLIERRTCITALKEDVAGTFDRVYRVVRDLEVKVPWSKTSVRLKAGEYVIGDLKTGRDLSYGWGEIAIQEALYAHGINDHGVWDPKAKEWQDPHTLEDVNVRLNVRLDVGVVVHLPIQKTEGNPACTVFAVDIAQGWEATELCVSVRRWRKEKKLATALEVVDTVPASALRPGPPPDQDELDRRSGATADRNDRIDANTGPRTASQAHVSPTAAQVASHPSVAAGRAVQAPSQPVVRQPTWEERAGSVSTKADASAIFQEMKKDYQKIGANRVNEVVKIMQKRLASLIENAG